MKRCSRCGKVKSLEEFYRNASASDGRQNRCRPCHVAGNRESRLRHLEDYRQRRDSYAGQDPAVALVRHKTWRAANKPKQNAHAAVQRALKKGCLERPDECQQCGRIGRVLAHHEDYSKQLEVIWLCSPCHGETHTKEKISA
jgi:ribosomal protein S27AE